MNPVYLFVDRCVNSSSILVDQMFVDQNFCNLVYGYYASSRDVKTHAFEHGTCNTRVQFP